MIREWKCKNCGLFILQSIMQEALEENSSLANMGKTCPECGNQMVDLRGGRIKVFFRKLFGKIKNHTESGYKMYSCNLCGRKYNLWELNDHFKKLALIAAQIKGVIWTGKFVTFDDGGKAWCPHCINDADSMRHGSRTVVKESDKENLSSKVSRTNIIEHYDMYYCETCFMRIPSSNINRAKLECPKCRRALYPLISITCPHCHRNLFARVRKNGIRTNCPHCSFLIKDDSIGDINYREI